MADDSPPPAVNIPLHDFAGIGFDMSEIDQGRGEASVELTERVRGFVAPLHGGMIATLVDCACAGTLTGSYDPAVEVPVTSDMHVRYYRQPRSSPVTARAQIVHRGSTLLGVDCVVVDGDERTLARASVSFVIVRGFGELADDA